MSQSPVSRLALTLALVVAGFALGLASPAQAATYTYQSAPFTSATAPWVVGGRVSGSISTSLPLPPVMPLTDIRDLISNLSYSDGVESRNLANSEVCLFEVATDSVGAIRQWRVSLRELVFNPGDPQNSIDSFGDLTVGGVGSDQGVIGPAGPGLCDMISGTASGLSSSNGTWSGTTLPTNPTTYNYTGAVYNSVQPPYVAGSRLTGSISTARPLSAFMPLTDISAALTGLSFDDSVETRTLANSFVCRVEVATDGAGNISQWLIFLRRSPFNPGDPHHAIDSSGEPGVIGGGDSGGTGLAPADPCGMMSLSPVASSIQQGTWTSSNPLPTNLTTYTYTGGPYTSADPPYALGGRVTGSISVANPLPPFMPLTDLSAVLMGLSFTDGVESRTSANSFLCRVDVATDGAGAIVEWSVSLRRFPFNPGDPHHTIDSSGGASLAGGGSDLAGTGVAPGDACGSMMGLTPVATSSVGGTWGSSNPLPVQPVSYTYEGDPFDFALPPYVLGDSVNGSITLAGPLPPNLPLTDISHALTDLSFGDGIAQRNFADTVVCGFNVGTDAAGQITRWGLSLRQAGVNVGDPQHTIDSTGPSGGIPAAVGDLGGSFPASGAACGSTALDVFGSSSTEGTWIGRQPAVVIPVLDGRGLAVLVGLLALAGLGVMRRRM